MGFISARGMGGNLLLTRGPSRFAGLLCLWCLDRSLRADRAARMERRWAPSTFFRLKSVTKPRRKSTAGAPLRNFFRTFGPSALDATRQVFSLPRHWHSEAPTAKSRPKHSDDLQNGLRPIPCPLLHSGGVADWLFNPAQSIRNPVDEKVTEFENRRGHWLSSWTGEH